MEATKKITGIEQYNQYKANGGTMSFVEWYKDGRYDKSLEPGYVNIISMPQPINRDDLMFLVKIIDNVSRIVTTRRIGIKELFKPWWPDDQCEVVYIVENTGHVDSDGAIIFVDDVITYVTGNPKKYCYALVQYGEYETYTILGMDVNGDFQTSAPPQGEIEKHIGFYLQLMKDDITPDYPSGKLPLGNLWIGRVGHKSELPGLTFL